MLYHIFVHKTFSALIASERLFNTPDTGIMFTDYVFFSPAKLLEQSQSSLVALLHMLYRLNGSESWYTWLMGSFSHIAYDTLERLRCRSDGQIDELEIKALRATLVMCTKGLWDQGRNLYLAEVLFHISL
jgi:hypothetical protein